MRPLALAIVFITSCTVHAGQVTVTDPYPMRGRPTEVVVTGDDGIGIAGAVVRITYRPNSMVTRIDSLGPTDVRGATEWVPTDAGISTLRASLEGAEIAARDVSIRFDRFPLQGIIVMIVAFCALFGGATVSLVMLFRSTDKSEETGALIRGT